MNCVRKPEQYDAVILYDEDDRPESNSDTSGEDSTDESEQNPQFRQINAKRGVKNLKVILETYVRVNETNNTTRLPKICDLHMDLCEGMGELKTIQEAIERSTYMFFYLSPSFSDADRAKVVEKLQKMKEDVLHETTNNDDKKNCAIPLYVMSRTETKQRNCQPPFGLRSIRGVDISGIMNDGSAIDDIDDPHLVKESEIDSDCLQRFSKIFSQRAHHLRERTELEITSLKLEEEMKQKKQLSEELEATKQIIETQDDNKKLEIEIEMNKSEIAGRDNLHIGRNRRDLTVNINIERTGNVQIGDNNQATLHNDESEDEYEVEELAVGKTANGHCVGQEAGDLAEVNVLSDGGLPVTSPASDERSLSAISPPLVHDSTPERSSCDSSLESFPSVNFPPTLGSREVGESPEQSRLSAEEAEMPVLDLTEEDAPSDGGVSTISQPEGPADRQREGLFSSLTSIISMGRQSGATGSGSESYMDSQEAEMLPGVNMRTLRLTTSALNNLIRRLSNRR